ncbi:MAG: hypothetical protein JWN98_926 [Abditibacteriota bacterium]|nr:hypothetical protein [Abditibacteriota bacterium]
MPTALKRQLEPEWREDDFAPGPISQAPNQTPEIDDSDDWARRSERAREVRRRARRRHRPLRLSFGTVLCGAALLGQLTLLLWMHGRALSSSHRAAKLDQEITNTRNQIARTQERIAAYDSSAHLEEWAKERGWKLADHRDFDGDVAKVLGLPEANAADQSTLSPATGTSASQSPAQQSDGAADGDTSTGGLAQ